MRPSTCLLILLSLAAHPLLGDRAPLAAQERPVRIAVPELLQRGTSSGWLGMQIAQAEERVADRTTTLWRIDRVVPESPAAEAGIRDGDRLVAVEGAAASEEVLDRLTTELEPGDEVQIRIEREGETLDFTVTAVRRPPFVMVRPDGEFRVLQMDTVLRGALPYVEMRADSVRIRAMPNVQMRVDSLQMPRYSLRFDSAQIRAMPRYSMRLDSARVHYDSTRVWSMPRYSLQFDSAQFRTMPPYSMQIDSARVQFDSLFRGYLRFDADSVRRFGVRADSLLVPGVAFGGGRIEAVPWSFAWSGLDAVAGVRMTEVNPELGAYFGVERGLLVTEVVEDTPGDRAGLRPGDVIVAIDGNGVDTVQELRVALTTAFRSGPVPLEVIRERRSLTLELPR